MLNRLYGITCDKPLNSKKIVSLMVGDTYHKYNSRKKSYITKGQGFYCDHADGYYEDSEIIVLADSNILRGKRKNKTINNHNNSDAAYIGKLFKKYGKDIPKHLNGAFAFIIWDNTNTEMFGARDHLGIKNLFYSYSNESLFLFATHLKHILKSNIVDKSLDQNAIYHFLFMKAFEQPSTPFINIKSLLPGHYFVLKDNTFSTEKYWDISFNVNTAIDEDSAMVNINSQFSDYFDHLFKNNDSQLYGVLLSGGIDSSYLTALMSQYNEEPIRTFTIKFGEEGSASDEAYYARIVSEAFKTKHTEIEINDTSIKETLIDLVWNMNTPVANSGYKLSSLLGLPASAELKYIILGEGADTLFGLDNRWRQFEIMENILLPFRIIPERFRESLYAYLEKIFKELTNIIDSKYVRGLHRYFFTKGGYFKWKGSCINENKLRKLFKNEEKLISIKKLYREYFRNVGTNNFLNKCTYTSLKTYTPNQQLTHSTSLCNVNGIEAMFPFLDVQLLEYCLNLPYSLKIKSGIKKYLLYKMAKSVLPAEILERPKEVFHMPFDHWLRGKLRPIVDDVFSRERIEKRGLFKYKEMVKLYDSYYIENKLPWVDLWSFVILELWLSIFYDSPTIQKPDNFENLINIRT